MIGKKIVVRQLVGRLVAVGVLFGAANWLAATPIMANTTVTPPAAANVGLTALYGAAVVGILFVLSSLSTLLLVASGDARKESGAGKR